MLGDFLQHQRNDPVSNLAPTPSRPVLAYYESELGSKWREENGEASVTKEGSLKLLSNINKNIL